MDLVLDGRSMDPVHESGSIDQGSMFCTFLYVTAICLIFRKMQICNLRNGALLIFWRELIMYNINNATSCIYEVLSNQNR